jgi:hypothetical protein
MKTFKDNAGRTWTIAVNIAAVKRVKSLLDIDLIEGVVKEGVIDELATNPILLCDVIYAICKPEADKQNITDEQFGQAMAGDAIELATEALLEELVDFFPEAKRRVLRKAMGRFKKMEMKALDAADKYLEDPEFEKEMDMEIERLMSLSGSLQELRE